MADITWSSHIKFDVTSDNELFTDQVLVVSGLHNATFGGDLAPIKQPAVPHAVSVVPGALGRPTLPSAGCARQPLVTIPTPQPARRIYGPGQKGFVSKRRVKHTLAPQPMKYLQRDRERRLWASLEMYTVG
jgi:hypothetical protein